MPQITMTPDQFVTFCRTLVAAIAADPMQQELKEVAEIFQEEQERNFASERDERGIAWAPRKQDYPWPPLRKTLAMHNATTDMAAPGNMTIITRRKMTLGVYGSDVSYAIHHHYGAPRANLPKRRFLYMKKDRLHLIHGPLKRAQVRVIQQHARSLSLR